MILLWTCGCRYLFKFVFLFSWDKYLKVELLCHMIVLFFDCLKTCQIVFHGGCTNLYFPSISFSPHPCQHCYFNNSISNMFVLIAHSGLDFHFPMPKPLTVWITINCGKFRKRWEYQTTWPASWETCIQVRKQELELDMEQ